MEKFSMKIVILCWVGISACMCFGLDDFNELNYEYEATNYYPKVNNYPYENGPIEDYNDVKHVRLPEYVITPKKLHRYRQKIRERQKSLMTPEIFEILDDLAAAATAREITNAVHRSTNRLEEDTKPDEFAYTPQDPRFYRDLQDLTPKNEAEPTTQKRENVKPTVPIDVDVLSVRPRSENSDEIPRVGDVVSVKPNLADEESAGVYVIAIVAGISAAATVGLIAVGIGWYNLQKNVKNASDVEYPAYGVTGPNKDVSPSGDRRLAQSAQMYHYQHQKQQIIAMERAPPGGDRRNGSVSEGESEEENEEGDYTVYECPGLAPTGEMEVKNPLFHDDDDTPAKKEEKN